MAAPTFANRAERRAAVAQMRAESAAYPVGQMLAIDPADWPQSTTGAPLLAVWRDRHFLAMLIRDRSGTMRLSINRTAVPGSDVEQWIDGIGWDDLQRIKAQCGFADICAVELFPPDACVVNVAAMRHLWLLASPPPFMWGAAAHRSGPVAATEDATHVQL